MGHNLVPEVIQELIGLLRPSHIKFPHISHGLWVVFACFIIAMYTGGVVSYGFTAIFVPIANEFSWSYTQVSIASSLRGAEVGVLAPVVGVLVDRFGTRPILFVGGILVGTGLLGLSQINSLPMFYATFIFIALGMSACSNTAMMAAVANWFKNRTGIAIGIMSCGYGFSGFMVPVVARLVDNYNWRIALIVLGIAIFAIVLPLSLLVRRQPKTAPVTDGAISAGISTAVVISPAILSGLTTRQAMKTRTFWHIAMALVAQGLLVSSVITHVMPFLQSVNFDRATASFVASLVPITSIIGRLGFGVLCDRVPKKILAMFGFIFLGSGMLLFAYAVDGIWLIALFLALFGIGYGGINTMVAILPREYFGMKSYGTTLGFVIGVSTIGSMIGPPLAGLVFDQYGDYSPIWLFYTAVAASAAILIAATPALKNTQK